jgi:hypothetical protein
LAAKSHRPNISNTPKWRGMELMLLETPVSVNFDSPTAVCG